MSAPALFMTELTVSDWAAAVDWYRRVLGLAVQVEDVAKGFALLRGHGGGRLALKAGTPTPSAAVLHFRVADLDAELARLAAAGIAPTGPIQASPEGYRRAAVRDPDGHAVGLFEWTHDGPPPAVEDDD